MTATTEEIGRPTDPPRTDGEQRAEEAAAAAAVGAVRQTAQMQYGLNGRTDARTDGRWIDGETNRRQRSSSVGDFGSPIATLEQYLFFESGKG